MSPRGPTPAHDPPWLPAWALAGALLLWPQPAWAAGFDDPHWVGAAIALGLFLVVVLAATWVLKRPSSKDAEPGSGTRPSAPPTQAPPAAAAFSDTRLGRLQQGIARHRRALKAGGKGFKGDVEVMARFLEGCGRMERGEEPPVAASRQLPPGALTRLTRLYEQLLGASPARARDWRLQRQNLSAQIRTILGQRDTECFLGLLDALAARRCEREGPSAEEAATWTEFVGQFRDAPSAAAPLSSSLDDEIPVAEDVPTADVLALAATQAPDEDAPTVDTDLLFPGGSPEEDAPTVDTDLLFPGEKPEEDAPTVDTDLLFPAETVEEPALEEDAPTVDTDQLFPATPEVEEDAPTVDTEHLFRAPEEGVGANEPPTVDTAQLFEPPGDTRPTTRRKRRGPKPTRASFEDTDELLDPVDDAPTRDTADLFRHE